MNCIIKPFCSLAVTFSSLHGAPSNFSLFQLPCSGLVCTTVTAPKEETKSKFFKPKGSLTCLTVRTKCNEWKLNPKL